MFKSEQTIPRTTVSLHSGVGRNPDRSFVTRVSGRHDAAPRQLNKGEKMDTTTLLVIVLLVLLLGGGGFFYRRRT